MILNFHILKSSEAIHKGKPMVRWLWHVNSSRVWAKFDSRTHLVWNVMCEYIIVFICSVDLIYLWIQKLCMSLLCYKSLILRLDCLSRVVRINAWYLSCCLLWYYGNCRGPSWNAIRGSVVESWYAWSVVVFEDEQKCKCGMVILDVFMRLITNLSNIYS